MNTNQAFTILANAGGVRAARIITENNRKLSWFRVWYIARMLRRNVPVAKIIGQKWFYGMRFFTNKYTLDPRPDTETLVAAVISDCGADIVSPKILDLGTGTGCVIISLVNNIHGAAGVGVDVSRRALGVANRNVRRYDLAGRISLKRASFDNINKDFDNMFDIIVSNPPYIAWGDARVDDGARHDPVLALYAEDNGYAAYRSIAKNAKSWLRDGGKIYLEIGIDMGNAVRQIFKDCGWLFVRSEKDLSNTERVLIFTK